MNTDATGHPLPRGWGKPRRRRSHAYRLRRAMRRRTRWRRIRDDHYLRMLGNPQAHNLWERAMMRVLALSSLIRRMGGKP